jgi:hypothetical protein
MGVNVTGIGYVGGAQVFTGQILAADGSASAPGIAFASKTNAGLYITGGLLAASQNGTLAWYLSSGAQLVASGLVLDTVSGDVILVRDAANTLAQKNSTNAQVIRWYKTTTGPQYAWVDTTGILMGTSGFAFTNGAAAATGTLTNAPAAGNPTKWIPVNDNGTTRYIPAW